jgi:ferredoxin
VNTDTTKTRRTLTREDFPHLFAVLRQRGYTVIGPTVVDGAIVYDEIDSPDQLPAGVTDEQSPGKYRLKNREDAALFGYVAGPHSWKKFLFPPVVRLWQARRTGGAMSIIPEAASPPRLAFLGVRACELKALQIQDRVFAGGEYVDPVYNARRSGAFIIAVNCTQAGGTCFCASMGTGPKVIEGFDLAITELINPGHHRFLIEAGTANGASVLAELPTRNAEAGDAQQAETAINAAARQMGRSLDTEGIRELLQGNLEHPRWQDVAQRCINCANCTMVCPTCFCSTVEDTTDLAGENAERWRKWDSCFTMDFSYIHGGSVRPSAMARYRQWMTHKLSTWYDQFGSSGCVGCGRCITWCPVGIDITEEARAIRQSGTVASHPASLKEEVH